jgi:hypothetical protein
VDALRGAQGVTGVSDGKGIAAIHQERKDSRLRSSRAATGDQLQATDDEVGHVADLLVDEHFCAIRSMPVDATNWRVGKKVLVAPAGIGRVDWPSRRCT